MRNQARYDVVVVLLKMMLMDVVLVYERFFLFLNFVPRHIFNCILI